MIKNIPFYKMHGCGNDFVFIDNRIARIAVAVMSEWAKALCRPHTGIGADGLVFLDLTPQNWQNPDPHSHLKPDYIWHFYNADGSRAGMCGNASRCAAILALKLGFAGAEHIIGTDVGLVRAQVDQDQAKVELPLVSDVRQNINLKIGRETFQVSHANTGVPHVLILFDTPEKLAQIDVQDLGNTIRHHPQFAPNGVNVNFACVMDRSHIRLRTYERGVEGETFACGTGAAASVYLTSLQGLTDSKVKVTTSGNEELGIDIHTCDGGEHPFLSGKATLVFTGELIPAAFNL